MSRAQIFLVKETECNLASLSLRKLLVNIKVFPSSFSIEVAFGNLRISVESFKQPHVLLGM